MSVSDFSIGDEVIRHYKNNHGEGDDVPTVIYDFDEDHLKCFHIQHGHVIHSCYPADQYRKTGNHYPEIQELYKKIQEED